MPSQNQTEKLIQEIAVKHGVALSHNDPIMILQTINNRLLEDGSKAQQALLQHHKEEMEAVAQRWGIEATTKAENIVNASLSASKAAMMEIMQEGASKTAASIQQEIDSSLTKLSNHIRDAQRISIFNLAAACITLVAASVALWATIP